MRLDAQDIADIRQGIRDEGVACQWESVSRVLVDADKPWLGSANTATTTDVWIAFVDTATAAALLTQWGKDSDVQASSRFGLMGNHAPLEPQVGQRVLRTGKEALVVKNISEASPADVPLFYLVEFSA
jgi:hypothetical protein